ERRHLTNPEGGVSAAGLFEMLERRGEDVLPYVQRHVPDHVGWGDDQSFGQIQELAAREGWWNLWGAVGRYQMPYGQFSKFLITTLAEPVDDNLCAARLLLLVGARTGWGQWSRTSQLSEEAALALYERF